MRIPLPHRILRIARLFAVASLFLLCALALVGVNPAAAQGPDGVAAVRLIDNGTPLAATPLGESSIGDYVWRDANADGDHLGAGNEAEREFTAGIGAVALELWRKDKTNNTWVMDASTTTDATGKYLFDNATALATEYEVRVLSSNFSAGGALVGYVKTSALTKLQPFTMPPGAVADYKEADFGYALAKLQVTKSPPTQTLLPGSTATFGVEIKNIGQVYVKNIALVDNVPGVTCNQSVIAGPLAPGATVTASCTRTNVQVAFKNTVSVSGTATDETGEETLEGDQPEATSNEVEVLIANPQVSVVKEVHSGVSWWDANTAPGPYLSAATSPRFRFTITNTGNVKLHTVTLDDNVYSLTPGCAVPTTLEVGASYQCEITPAWSIGAHLNTATTSGKYTDDSGVTATRNDTDDANYFGAQPLVTLLKEVWDGAAWQDAESAPGPYILKGTNPRFRLKITNTGNVTLNVNSLTDSVFTLTPDCAPPATLASAAVYSCEFTRPWTSGQHSNTATVTTSYTGDDGVRSDPTDSDKAHYFGADAAIKIVKTAGSAADGTVLVVNPPTPVSVQYTYKVTNIGNLPIFLDKPATNPTYGVTDNKCSSVGYASGDADNDGLLDLAEEWTFTCTIGLSVDTVNTGTAVGDPRNDQGSDLPGVPDVTSSDTAEVRIYYGVGDKVWWDVDANGLQDAGEPGITGAHLNLSPASATTNASGIYQFTTVAPGSYTMLIPASDLATGGPLAGFTPTTALVGSDRAVDSNGSVNGTGDVVASFTLPVGAADQTIDFGFVKPTNYTIVKTLKSDFTVYRTEEVIFEITITNTGSTWIETLPLVDVYNPTYLTYGYNMVYSLPASVNNDNDGSLNWPDLTGSGSLAPDQSTTVTLHFTAAKDTWELPDHVTINTGTVPKQGTVVDPDGSGPIPSAGTPLNDISAQDDVWIQNPTNVVLASAQLVYADGGILVEWVTADETNLLGFNLLRGASAETLTPVNAELVLARYVGLARGGAYSVRDAAPTEGALYALELIALDGSVTRIALPRAGVAR